MSEIKDKGYLAFDDYNTSNVPVSGAKKPKKVEIRAFVDAVDSAVSQAIAGDQRDRGVFTPAASSGTTGYPTTGGSGVAGAIKARDSWTASEAGYVRDVAIAGGDVVIAKVDTPGQTAANWSIVDRGFSYTPEDQSNKISDLGDATAETYLNAAALSGIVDNLAPKVTAQDSRIRQVIGRTGNPITGTAFPNAVVVQATDCLFTGYIKTVRFFALTTGAVAIKIYTRSGNDLTQVGSDYVITVTTTGLQSHEVNIPVLPGQKLGAYGKDIMTYSANPSDKGFWQSGAGNVGNFTDSTTTGSVRLEFGFDIVETEAGSTDANQRADASDLVLDKITATQSIGLTGTPATGTASNVHTYAYATPAARDGYIGTIDYYGLTSGVMYVKVGTYSSSTFTQSGPDYPVAIKEGLNQATPKDFGAIPVAAGQVIGFYNDGNFLPYITASNAPLGGFYNDSGTENLTTFSDAGINTTLNIQMRFGLVAAVVTDDRMTAAEGAISDLTEAVVVYDQEIFGRPADITLIDDVDTTTGSRTIVFGNPSTLTGEIYKIEVVTRNAVTVSFGLYSVSGDTKTLQRSVALACSAGVPSVFYADDDFTLAVNAGEHVGYSCPTNGVTYRSEVESGNQGGVWIATSLNPSSFDDSTLSNSLLIQIRFWVREPSESTLAELISEAQEQVASVAPSIYNTDVTIGGSLYGWRGKAGAKLKNGTGVLRVIIMGDSWTQKPEIPEALKALMVAKYGASGYGWISCDDQDNTTGLVHTTTGTWTVFDAGQSDGEVHAIPAGLVCGLDGKISYATGTTSTRTITVSCNEFDFWLTGTGTGFYTVDGGSAVALSCPGADLKAKTTISGLSTASHTFVFTLTGNAGTVGMTGFHARLTAAGVEFNKCGNTSLDESQMLSYLDTVQPELNAIAPDLVIFILGTNSYRRTHPLSDFTDATTMLTEMVREANPLAGMVLYAPADTAGSAETPVTRYVAEFLRLSSVLDVEFFSNWRLFGTWAESDAQGLMDDTLHLSALGGFVATNELFGRLRL